MKKPKRIISIISASLFLINICKIDFNNYNVNSAESLVIDYSNVEKNPYNQFYYSDENEFFIDGITVLYNNKDVTSETTFTFFTTPATTYDGKNFDYVVPFTADYENLSADGQIYVKIGLRGDANCDHKVTLSDLVLVENEMLQNFYSKKSALTANDELGIFLSNVDGIQKNEYTKPFGINDLNIADAFYIKSYLNNHSKSMYENVLLKYANKIDSGELSVSSAGCKSGNIATIYISQKSNNSLGAFDFSFKWSDPDLELISINPVDNDVTVFSALTDEKLRIWGFGNNKNLKNGDFLALQFKVPQNASVNKSYDVYVHEINYFGSGTNISSKVMTNDGKIRVTSKGTNSVSVSPIEKINLTNYDYGIKVWDESVKYGTESVSVPILLLGGLQTKGFEITISCSDPLKFDSLSNAVSVSMLSDSVTAIYESDDFLPIDFETLKIKVNPDTKPGRYPINITVKDISSVDNNSTMAVYNGYITVREKSVVCGDANQDGKVTIRDAAYISNNIAKGKGTSLTLYSDYNADGNVNIRDAASLSRNLANLKN